MSGGMHRLHWTDRSWTWWMSSAYSLESLNGLLVEQKGEIELPTHKPGNPAWTSKIPVEGAVLKVMTRLDYEIDDTIER